MAKAAARAKRTKTTGTAKRKTTNPASKARARTPSRARKTSSEPRTAARAQQTATRETTPHRELRIATHERSPAPVTPLTTAAVAVGRALGRTVEAVASRVPFTNHRGDALTLLENDHRRLEALLTKGEETTERAVKTRTDLLETIAAELSIHEEMEEKILYPALKSHAEAVEIVLEGYQEHHVADVLVKELHALPAEDERWGAKFKVLKENIEHHIEEEEGEMFKIARSVLTRAEREQLGVRMQAMKVARR
jgi:hemerythrin-like domain-containing protein